MSFLIRFGVTSFLENIPGGSTVYFAPFTQGHQEDALAFVLLTSDAGIPGGTIHAIRIRIETNKAGELTAGEATTEASSKLVDLLTLKGITTTAGVLSTEGLDDALKLYSNSGPVSIEQLDRMLAREKKVEAIEKDKAK